MIAASGILVVVAFVTLILGVFRTGLGLIWTSIAASILAAIFLALGVVQGNKRRVADRRRTFRARALLVGSAFGARRDRRVGARTRAGPRRGR